MVLLGHSIGLGCGRREGGGVGLLGRLNLRSIQSITVCVGAIVNYGKVAGKQRTGILL